MADAQRNVMISLKLTTDSKNQATVNKMLSQAESVSTAWVEAARKLNVATSTAEKSSTDVLITESNKRLSIAIESSLKREKDVLRMLEKIQQAEKFRTENMLKTNQKIVASVYEMSQKIIQQSEDVSKTAISAYRELGEAFARGEVINTQTHKDELEKRTTKEDKENKKREKMAQKLNKKIQEAEKKRVESQQKANESAVAAIQGMAEMVEGAAKLGLVSEENYQKFAKYYEIVQAGIQVFKGATDMWWKGREALIALSTATKTQTTLNNLMAISSARAPAAGVAGQVAVEAGGAAVGGVAQGGTVLGGAKVLGGIGLAAAKVASIALVATEAIQGVRRAFGDTGDSAESIVGALWTWRKAANEAEESTKNLAKAEKRRQKLIDARKQYEDQQAVIGSFRKDLRAADRRIGEVRGIVSGEDPIKAANRQRLDAVRDLKAAEMALLEDRQVQEERIAAGHFKSSGNILRLQKDLEQAQSNLLEAELRRLAVVRDQNKEVSEQLKSEREKLRLAEEAGKSQEEQLLVRFGKLKPSQRVEVNAIASKRAAGQELSGRDIRILEKAGLEGDITTGYHARVGAAAGGRQSLRALGFYKQSDENIANAQGKVHELTGRLQDGKAEAALIKATIGPTAEMLKMQTEERIKVEAELKNVLLDTIKEFKEGLPEVGPKQAIQQAAADAADAITQQSMQAVNAIKVMQNTTVKGFEDMQKQLEDVQLKKNAYHL